MATTASRVAKGRPTTGKRTTARGTPPRGSKPSSPKLTTLPAKQTKTPPSAGPLVGLRGLLASVTQPGRVSKLMDSVQSVQEAPTESATKWPLWRKIALWAVMLMPLYAILIYFIGGLWFLPAEIQGVGLNKSLPTKVLKVMDGISIPDQEGVFLQTGTDPKQPLNLLMPFNDRALKPPTNQQFSLTGGSLRYVLVEQAQVSLPTDYQVFQIDNKDIDHLVKGVVAQRVPVARIALISLAMPNGQTWAPGSYVLVTPDLDDGTYYYFFTVTK